MNIWKLTLGSWCFRLLCLPLLGVVVVVVIRVQAALAFCRQPHSCDHAAAAAFRGSSTPVLSHRHGDVFGSRFSCSASTRRTLWGGGGGHCRVSFSRVADNNNEPKVLPFPEEEGSADARTSIETKKPFSTWKKLPLTDSSSSGEQQQHVDDWSMSLPLLQAQPQKEPHEAGQQQSIVRMILQPIFSIATFAVCSYCCLAVWQSCTLPLHRTALMACTYIP
jgi:hypothetical protein